MRRGIRVARLHAISILAGTQPNSLGDDVMSMEMNERSSWGSGGSDLRRELRVLWAHRWLVVTTAAILIGLAAAYTFLRTPIYTATTTVFIKPTGISSSDLAGADIGKLISPETEVAIDTLVSVRDKVVSAYEEIMRMPI